MATGDQSDINNRILVLLPPWFPSSAPILAAVISAIAFQLAFIYSLFAYAKSQMRLQTATDGFLDTWAADFFGILIQRKAGQSDVSWLNTIIFNLFLERVTRQAMINILNNLTNFTPEIFECSFPQSRQTGGYGVACGYGSHGRYASQAMVAQVFIDEQILSDGSVLSADVFTAADSTRAAGIDVWLNVISGQWDYKWVSQTNNSTDFTRPGYRQDVSWAVNQAIAPFMSDTALWPISDGQGNATFMWYRYSFLSNANTDVVLSIGDSGFGVDIWLNGNVLGSYSGTSVNITIPFASLNDGKNMIAIRAKSGQVSIPAHYLYYQTRIVPATNVNGHIAGEAYPTPNVNISADEMGPVVLSAFFEAYGYDEHIVSQWHYDPTQNVIVNDSNGVPYVQSFGLVSDAGTFHDSLFYRTLIPAVAESANTVIFSKS